MAKIKTINFRFMAWFGVVFAIGAVAVALMSRSIICGEVQIVAPMYLGISLFGAFGLAGIIGIIVLLRKHFVLKRVLKHGTETVGEFVEIDKYVDWSWGSPSRKYGWDFNKKVSSIRKVFAAVTFSYMVDKEKRQYTSCAVYLYKQVEKLKALKTFSVKYKGKHAIICEIV